MISIKIWCVPPGLPGVRVLGVVVPVWAVTCRVVQTVLVRQNTEKSLLFQRKIIVNI